MEEGGAMFQWNTRIATVFIVSAAMATTAAAQPQHKQGGAPAARPAPAAPAPHAAPPPRATPVPQASAPRAAPQMAAPKLRHTSPHRELRRTLPHRVTRLCKLAGRARRKRAALGRSSLPVRPAARPPRPWRGMRRRREPLRFRRSNSRKSPAAIPADKLDRRWPNPARAAISRAKPRQRALRQRRALGQQRRALPQQHSPLASDAMGPRNKAWLRSRAQFSRRAAWLHRPALGRLATRAPSPAASCAIRLLPTWPVPAIPVRARSQTRRSKAGSSSRKEAPPAAEASKPTSAAARPQG